MQREKSVEELIQEMERTANALNNPADPSEAIGDGIEAAIARHQAKPVEMDLPPLDVEVRAEKTMTLPEMDFSGNAPPPVEVAEQRNAAAAERVTPRVPAMAAPPPKSGALDWDALLKKQRGSAILDDAVNAGNHALSRYSAAPPLSRSSRDLAKLPLEIAQAKQGFESRQVGIDASRAAAEAKAAASDPSSPASQRARETWKAMGLPTPAGFEEWSAADVRAAGAGDFVKVGQMRAAAEDRAAKAKAKAEADAAKGVESAKRRGEDLKYRDEQAERADRSAQRQDAMLGLALRGAEDKDKKKTEGLPFDMELAEGANPSAQQLKDLGLAETGRRDVHKLAEEMRGVLKSTSGRTDRLTGDTRRELNRIAAEMTIAAKNAGGLGQITAGDEALINAIRPDATGFESLLRDDASFSTQLVGLEKWADNKVSAGMETMGARRKKATGAAEPSVTVVQKATGKTRTMAKSKADALLKAPGGDAYEVR